MTPETIAPPMYAENQDQPSCLLTEPAAFCRLPEVEMDAAELDRRVRLRRLIVRLRDDLVDMGYPQRTVARLQAMELLELRQAAIARLMEAPRGAKEA